MTLADRDEMAELALKRVRESGAEYGDIRLVHSTSQTINGEDRRIASVRDVADSGFGVRVLYHGGWGFCPSRKCRELPIWRSRLPKGRLLWPASGPG